MPTARQTMTSAVRAARRRSVTVDKAAYLASLHRRSGRDPVLVFTMGKVGSTALGEMVGRGTGRSVLHFHRASRKGLRRSSRLWKSEGSSYRPHEDWRGWYVRQRARLHRSATRWDMVTGVRDPMAQLVSATFQVGPNLGLFDLDSSADAVDLDRITDRVVAFGRTGDSWRWFNDELAPFTGIDVLDQPFPSGRGWAEYENDRFRVLLVRTEDLATVASAAVGAFFGLDQPPPLAALNVGSAKGYADLYRRYVAEAVLPVELLDAAYGCPMARHFYTVDELDDFRSRWQCR